MDLGRGLFLSGFSGDLRATSVPSPQTVALVDLTLGGGVPGPALKSPSRPGAHSRKWVGRWG